MADRNGNGLTPRQQAEMDSEWSPDTDGILRRSAARVILFDPEGRIFLIRGHDVGDLEHTWWFTVGGGIDSSENPRDGACRELLEETGYKSEELINLINYYQDQGCSKAKIYSFLALNCEKIKEQSLDKDEYVKYFECSFDEAVELVESGYISDANSILTIELSKKYIKR